LPLELALLLGLELIVQRLGVVVVYYPENLARLQGLPFLKYIFVPFDRRQRPQVQVSTPAFIFVPLGIG
jgi:hypothetical protein